MSICGVLGVQNRKVGWLNPLNNKYQLEQVDGSSFYIIHGKKKLISIVYIRFFLMINKFANNQ